MIALLTCLFVWGADKPAPVEPEALTRRLSGKLVQVEDLVTSTLGTGENRRVRLMRCPEVSFRLRDDAPKEISGNVRMTGTVKVEASQVVVDVRTVELLPSDVDQYEKRRSAIRTEDPAAWYELGLWANRRFKLYRDSAMEANAREAYQQGIDSERRLAQDDPARLLALRDRLSQQTLLPSVDLDELDHHLARTKLPPLKNASADMLEQAAADFAKATKVDSTIPPRAKPTDERTYEAQPIPTYQKANAPVRLSLARTVVRKLLKQAATERVATGVWDEFEAARQTKQQLPDEPEVAAEWMEKGIAKKEGLVGELRMKEADDLARLILAEKQDTERAARLRDRWLTEAERKMIEREQSSATQARDTGRPAPIKDVRARYEWGEARLSWFPGNADQQKQAARLFLEALAVEPNFEPAAEGLKQLGYRRAADGKWQDPEEASRADQERAELPKSASVGMDDVTVRKIHGEPSREARIITGPRLVEKQWRYDGLKQSLYINFRTDGAGQWRVADLRRIDVDAPATPNSQVE